MSSGFERSNFKHLFCCTKMCGFARADPGSNALCWKIWERICGSCNRADARMWRQSTGLASVTIELTSLFFFCIGSHTSNAITWDKSDMHLHYTISTESKTLSCRLARLVLYDVSCAYTL